QRSRPSSATRVSLFQSSLLLLSALQYRRHLSRGGSQGWLRRLLQCRRFRAVRTLYLIDSGDGGIECIEDLLPVRALVPEKVAPVIWQRYEAIVARRCLHLVGGQRIFSVRDADRSRGNERVPGNRHGHGGAPYWLWITNVFYIMSTHAACQYDGRGA